jgi:hypothetical protein
MPLPLVLAGPILRRADPGRVCIWLATSEKIGVRGEVFADPRGSGSQSQDPIGTSDPDRGGRETPVRLGDHLFVHLLEVKPPKNGQFPRDTLLGYDVTVETDNLAGLKLLEGKYSIAYDGLELPSFFLASELRTLAHGSCRKPHAGYMEDGGPTEDRLAVADRIIAKAPQTLDKRPAILFLTGDQIYADDVGLPLMPALMKLGQEITGWQESIPELENLADIPLSQRGKALEAANSGFTSGESENHLLTFGEYAAMYLAVWGGTEVGLTDWGDIQDLFPHMDDEETAKHKSIYDEQFLYTKKFAGTLPKVRRALANIPTYMIFDDHDVTDDWNLNRRWYRHVSDSACGRRVVSNALAAYWAFQGWGNYPEGISSRLIDAISNHVCGKLQDGNAAERFDRRLWNKRGWGYTVPFNPPNMVLDTRTQREFDSNRGPARLMDRYGLGWLQTAWADLKQQPEYSREKDLPLIIVSPSPVYGFEPVEFMQKFLVRFSIKRPAEVDFESWIGNREGFGALMHVLTSRIDPSWCLFLSGDVHYSFTNRAEFVSNGKTLKVWQATSSPLHGKGVA